MGATNSWNFFSSGIHMRLSLKIIVKDRECIKRIQKFIQRSWLYTCNIINFLLIKSCSTVDKDIILSTATSSIFLCNFYNQKEKQKKDFRGIPWQCNGQDARLPLLRPWVQSLIRKAAQCRRKTKSDLNTRIVRKGACDSGFSSHRG